MNNQDKVRKVLHDQLIPLGWQSVFNENSGVFVKNGFQLVLYGNKLQKPDISKSFTNSDVIANSMIMFALPQVSWHIEKHGWLITKGQISSDVASFYDFPQAPDNIMAVKQLIEKIEDIANHDDFYSFSKRTREKPVTTLARGKVLALAENTPVTKTLMFRYVLDVVQLHGILEINKDYVVVDTTETAIFVAEILTNTEIATASSKSLEKTVFSQCCKVGVFKALDFVEGTQEITSYETVSAADESVIALPPELEVFGLTGVSKLNLCTAYKNNLNYTALLYNNLSDEESTAMLRLIEFNKDISSLFGKKYSANHLGLFYNFLRKGYCLDVINRENADFSTIELTANDFLQSITELEEDLRQKEFDVSAIQAITQLYTYHYDYEHVLQNKKGIDLFLIDEQKNGKYPEAARLLLESGVSTENLCYVYWSSVTNEVKAVLRQSLSTTIPLSVCGVAWDDYLDILFEKALYLIYTREHGFLVRIGNTLFGRDANSVVVYDVSMSPVWRAVLFNGQFTVNRENEDVLKIW